MAQGNKIGKGRGPDLKSAAEAAKADSGHSGWFKVTEIYVKVENPLREYFVILAPVDNPPS
jgi:hypothetical protein